MAINVTFTNYSKENLKLDSSLYEAGGPTGWFGAKTWFVSQDAGSVLSAYSGVEQIVIDDTWITWLAQQYTYVKCVWQDSPSGIYIGVYVWFPGQVVSTGSSSNMTWSVFYGKGDPTNMDNWLSQGGSVAPYSVGGGSSEYSVTYTPVLTSSEISIGIVIQNS